MNRRYVNVFYRFSKMFYLIHVHIYLNVPEVQLKILLCYLKKLPHSILYIAGNAFVLYVELI